MFVQLSHIFEFYEYTTKTTPLSKICVNALRDGDRDLNLPYGDFRSEGETWLDIFIILIY